MKSCLSIMYQAVHYSDKLEIATWSWDLLSATISQPSNSIYLKDDYLFISIFLVIIWYKLHINIHMHVHTNKKHNHTIHACMYLKGFRLSKQTNLIKQGWCDCTLNLKYNSALSGHSVLLGLKHLNQ